MALTPNLLLPAGNEVTPVGLKLAWEKELLGIYVSGHPLDAHEDKRTKAGTTIQEILENPEPGKAIILPVLLTQAKMHLTKGGERMAFVTFEDKTGSIEAAIFPKLFKDHTASIVPGTCLLIKGTVSIRNGEATLSVENLKAL